MHTKLTAYIRERMEDLNKQLDVAMAAKARQYRIAYLDGRLAAYTELYQAVMKGEV